jgi:Reverse transcriptase (RNA-dependent DNA polymerase)
LSFPQKDCQDAHPCPHSLVPYICPQWIKRLIEKRFFTLRYRDDFIILVKNKRQYTRARKRLFKELRALGLEISSAKSRIGKLKPGFHFQGVDFVLPQSTQTKNQGVLIRAHKRTYQRALDKVTALSPNADYPATFQRTLVRWATWWHSVLGGDQQTLLGGWTRYCIKHRFNAGFVAVSSSLMLDKESLSA